MWTRHSPPYKSDVYLHTLPISYHSSMGYDASVFVVFGVHVSFDVFAAFARKRVQSNPMVLAHMIIKEFDVDEYDELLEYIDNFSLDLGSGKQEVIQWILGDYQWNDVEETGTRVISCFRHEHSVVRTRDDCKAMSLPSDETCKRFIQWLKNEGLPHEPRYMTFVVD